MFGLGTTELIIILVILVMVFGLGKLPNAANRIGEAIGAFRSGMEGDEDAIEIGENADDEPAKLEDDQVEQAARDASLPHQQETQERSANGGTV